MICRTQLWLDDEAGRASDDYSEFDSYFRHSMPTYNIVVPKHFNGKRSSGTKHGSSIPLSIDGRQT